MTTFDAINHFFLISQMVISGQSYCSLGIGLENGDVSSDEEGLETIATLR